MTLLRSFKLFCLAVVGVLLVGALDANAIETDVLAEIRNKMNVALDDVDFVIPDGYPKENEDGSLDLGLERTPFEYEATTHEDTVMGVFLKVMEAVSQTQANAESDALVLEMTDAFAGELSAEDENYQNGMVMSFFVSNVPDAANDSLRDTQMRSEIRELYADTFSALGMDPELISITFEEDENGYLKANIALVRKDLSEAEYQAIFEAFEGYAELTSLLEENGLELGAYDENGIIVKKEASDAEENEDLEDALEDAEELKEDLEDSIDDEEDDDLKEIKEKYLEKVEACIEKHQDSSDEDAAEELKECLEAAEQYYADAKDLLEQKQEVEKLLENLEGAEYELDDSSQSTVAACADQYYTNVDEIEDLYEDEKMTETQANSKLAKAREIYDECVDDVEEDEDEDEDDDDDTSTSQNKTSTPSTQTPGSQNSSNQNTGSQTPSNQTADTAKTANTPTAAEVAACEKKCEALTNDTAKAACKKKCQTTKSNEFAPQIACDESAKSADAKIEENGDTSCVYVCDGANKSLSTVTIQYRADKILNQLYFNKVAKQGTDDYTVDSTAYGLDPKVCPEKPMRTITFCDRAVKGGKLEGVITGEGKSAKVDLTVKGEDETTKDKASAKAWTGDSGSVGASSVKGAKSANTKTTHTADPNGTNGNMTGAMDYTYETGETSDKIKREKKEVLMCRSDSDKGYTASAQNVGNVSSISKAAADGIKKAFAVSQVRNSYVTEYVGVGCDVKMCPPAKYYGCQKAVTKTEVVQERSKPKNDSCAPTLSTLPKAKDQDALNKKKAVSDLKNGILQSKNLYKENCSGSVPAALAAECKSILKEIQAAERDLNNLGV